jgi:Transferase family
MPFIFAQTLDSQLMASSLAAMLSRYALFAGRLNTSSLKNTTSGGGGGGGRYQVALCNKGASLTLATCDFQLKHVLPDDLLSPVNKNNKINRESFLYAAPDLSPFLPAIPNSILGYCNHDDVPIFHAQITHLHGGGTVLAVVIPHLIADQETCRLVLKAWASEYTAACIAAQMELNSSGPIRMLSAIFEDDGSSLEEESSLSSASSSDSTENSLDTASDDGEGESNESSSLPKGGEISQESLNSTVSNTSITANTMSYHSGHVLEAHASPALPPYWSSLRFEKRSWSFYPSIACSFLWHVGSFNNLSTVTYYVSATRLAALKTEASQDLHNAGREAPCAPAWISKNDALAARIRQAVALLPGKSSTRMQLWVNLRKRMVPPLPYPALGNCSWPVTVINSEMSSAVSSSPSPSLSLGSLAAEVRAAIQTVNNHEYISQELRWLEDAFSSSTTTTTSSSSSGSGSGVGTTMPCVFKNAAEILKVSGPLMLSHWDWGGSNYSDLQFGLGNTLDNVSTAPIWHQPPYPKVPNCAFVVPAAAAPGKACGGVLVHITLHKRLAEELKRICPAL